jgi:hypothetical protein
MVLVPSSETGRRISDEPIRSAASIKHLASWRRDGCSLSAAPHLSFIAAVAQEARHLVLFDDDFGKASRRKLPLIPKLQLANFIALS